MSGALETGTHGAIKEFVEHQTTRRVAELLEPGLEIESPYASYYYKAIACVLLSGRVAAKFDGSPNMTDVHRVCKEANFNPYLFKRIAKFFVAAKVVVPDLKYRKRYIKGESFRLYWEHAPTKLVGITANAVLSITQEHTGYRVYRPTTIDNSHLIDFLRLFFSCFDGLALREQDMARAFGDFAAIPAKELMAAAKSAPCVKKLGLKLNVADYDWSSWLDPKGQEALLSAMYLADWAFCVNQGKTDWIFLSPIGLSMLQLAKSPPARALPMELKALPDRSVFAGAGHPFEILVPLFAHCKIKRIDTVFEFQIDHRRLAEAASGKATKELREALSSLTPLPNTIASVLQTKSDLGGVVRVRSCNALVKTECTDAIRRHPKLKGYIEPGAPAGYLLIKSTANLGNFVRRCQELGFEVRQL